MKLAAFCFFGVAAGKLHRTKLALDNNQKVYIEEQPVVGDGSGEGALNKCRPIAPQHVANPKAPDVRVCGTNIKATFYLRGRCENYHHYTKQIGKCDTGLPPSTCDTWGPGNDERFGAYQSYKIEQC
jgi:hypothetical protein